ncbi:hypothetical protein JGU71_06800 [Antrihabitans sp. YC3-6]|uniref:Excreted virulence factor EspC, type VII ESX diderm n=1 Tax=Antrihabitans stalagmiti TaxID=2799499 RepID=A0A934NNV8_9NOCA|nr:type VII secretion target [Antrihabitans stalagmiti]MBJ8338587.1 hypothetical protein [Antrihabitans stalagmiti]
MSDVAAVPDAIRAYGDVSAGMAAAVVTAGTIDTTATVAAMVPVFGLIGQDFLAAFAVAQGNHIFSIGQLAAVHAGTAAAAITGAAEYETVDTAAGATFDSIGKGV